MVQCFISQYYHSYRGAIWTQSYATLLDKKPCSTQYNLFPVQTYRGLESEAGKVKLYPHSLPLSKLWSTTF